MTLIQREASKRNFFHWLFLIPKTDLLIKLDSIPLLFFRRICKKTLFFKIRTWTPFEYFFRIKVCNSSNCRVKQKESTGINNKVSFGLYLSIITDKTTFSFLEFFLFIVLCRANAVCFFTHKFNAIIELIASFLFFCVKCV